MPQINQEKTKMNLLRKRPLLTLLVAIISLFIFYIYVPSIPLQDRVYVSEVKVDEELLNRLMSFHSTQSALDRVAGKEWRKYTSVSVMDDTKTVQIELIADNTLKSLSIEVSPILTIRCKDNKTELFINMWHTLSIDFPFDLLIRFDNDKPFTESWTMKYDYDQFADKIGGKRSPLAHGYGLFRRSNNYAADRSRYLQEANLREGRGGLGGQYSMLFAPSAISMAKKINESERMLVEIPARGLGFKYHIIRFDVEGLGVYLGELAQSCNWSL